MKKRRLGVLHLNGAHSAPYESLIFVFKCKRLFIINTAIINGLFAFNDDRLTSLVGWVSEA